MMERIHSRWCRPFQFSLRSLFALMTLVALLVAWRGERAVRWIESWWMNADPKSLATEAAAPLPTETLSDEEIRRIASHIGWGPGLPPGVEGTLLRTRWDSIDCTDVPII